MMIRLFYIGFRIYLFIFRPVSIGIRVMMIQNNKVLLVRQTYTPGWFLPGGGVKRGETLEQAARREAKEETGAELGELQLMGAYTNLKEMKTDHNVVFTCTDFTYSGKHDNEIAEIRLFGLDKLPEGLWPGHRQRLEEYQAGIKNPQHGEW
jgi:8-oxo-dGTP pyrophosphatase MutT (NUDIX family)